MSENMESPVTEEEVSIQAEPAEKAAPAEETAVEAPSAPTVEAPKKKARKVKKPRPWPVKILLELIAIILCLVIFVMTVAGALALDLRVMTSRGGIQKIVTQLIVPSLSAPSFGPFSQVRSVSAPRLSKESVPTEESAGLLTDLVYDMLQKEFGQEIPISKDQVSQFVTESSLPEFFTDKLAGAAEDFYNETSETTITRAEVVELVRDNAELIEETFEVEVTEERIEQIETTLEQVEAMDKLEGEGLMVYLEDTYLTEQPGQTGSDVSGGTVIGSTGSSAGIFGSVSSGFAQAKQIMGYVRTASSYTTLMYIGGGLLVLMLLLWLVNGTLPKTLSDLGITLLFAGLLLSSVNILANSGVLTMMLPGQVGLIGLISGMLSAISVVHYSILGAGLVLILLAIAAKIIKSSRQKKALLAAQ